METQTIIKRLSQSQFLFTEAHKLRDEVRKLDQDELNQLVAGLHAEMGKYENAPIKKALHEVVSGLKR